MYHSILVPLDGSALAEQALPTAVRIARRSGATLTLLRVQPERRASQSLLGEEMLAELRAMYDRHRVEACDYLAAVAERLARETGVDVRMAVNDGPIADAIRRYTITSGIDLIVMTTHGRTGFSRAWLGSVADAVVRHVRIPVLLWRPLADSVTDDRRTDDRLFQHVVIPLDGSDEAEAILGQAASLAGSPGTRWTLLRVVSPIVAPPSALPLRLAEAAFEESKIEERVARAKAQLDAAADRVRSQAGDAEIATDVIVDQSPARAILAHAERGGADLITMATHGRGSSRYVLGSVADKVLRGAEGAVLLYRPLPD